MLLCHCQRAPRRAIVHAVALNQAVLQQVAGQHAAQRQQLVLLVVFQACKLALKQLVGREGRIRHS